MWNRLKNLIRKHVVASVFAGLAAAVLLTAVGSAGWMHYGIIDNPRYCNTCHAVQYDVSRYSPFQGVRSVSQRGRQVGLTPETGPGDPLPVKLVSRRGVQVGCAECHPHPYSEYLNSSHARTKLPERPGCMNCHTAHTIGQFAGFMWWNADAWKLEIGPTASLKDKGMWVNEVMPKKAEKARLAMLESDSATCRTCHVFDAILPTRKRGQRAHADAKQKNRTNCIACHYNLVHAEAPLTPAFSQAIKAAAGPPDKAAQR